MAQEANAGGRKAAGKPSPAVCPGYVIDDTADLHFNAPLAHATSCRTTSEMPLAFRSNRCLKNSDSPATQGHSPFYGTLNRHNSSVDPG
jgi:hypothetical protein